MASIAPIISAMSSVDLQSDTHIITNTHNININIKKFYKLMMQLLIKFKSSYIKGDNENNNDFKVKFILYFIKHLYDEYGIMRRNIQNNLIILYYNKSAKGYKQNDSITMICRHLILDTTTMGIVSFGIPRAIRLEDYIKQYNIDPSNALTNPDIYVFNQPEGVMFTWNPSLKTTTPETTPETILTNIYTEYYTRTQVGGNNSFVNDDNKSSITFLEMFNNTNTNKGTRLDLIPPELTKDSAFVFNLENNSINSLQDNINTLVAIYKFKSSSQVLIEYNNIIECVLQTETPNTQEAPETPQELSDTTLSKLSVLFDVLCTDMITTVNIDEFINKLLIKDIDIKVSIPDEIKSFTCYTTDDKGVVLTIEIPKHKMSIMQLQGHTNYSNGNSNGKSKGYIVYDNNGNRTKIINKDFKHKQDLRGSNSITISRDPVNSINLFTHYWDKLLRIENGVQEFIIEFDKLPVCLLLGDTLPPRYEDIFKMFAYHIASYSVNLHNTYVLAYALKRINKTDIPFSMIPLCKDLHALFYKYKTPINIDIVNKYIFTLPANKVFWRVFPNITPTQQDIITTLQ